MSKKESTTISLVIPSKLKDKIWVLAEKDGRTPSNLIRKVLIEKFKV